MLFPDLGLISLAGSALLGAFLLHRNKISYGGSLLSLSPVNILMIDFALAVLFLGRVVSRSMTAAVALVLNAASYLLALISTLTNNGLMAQRTQHRNGREAKAAGTNEDDRVIERQRQHLADCAQDRAAGAAKHGRNRRIDITPLNNRLI